MEDKVVLVTGSSAGIGEATAYRFAKLGCKLVVHGTDVGRLSQVAKTCSELSPQKYMVCTLQRHDSLTTRII